MNEEQVDLNLIFNPRQALRRNERDSFVGRGNLLTAALANLSTRGTALAIIGERGIGKTSFAERVREYVSGDKKWVQDHIGKLRFVLPPCDVAWIDISKYHYDFFGVVIDLLSIRGRRLEGAAPVLTHISRVSQETDIAEDLLKLVDPDKLRVFHDNLAKADSATKKDDVGETEAHVAPPNLIKGNQHAVLDLFRRSLELVASRTGKRIIFFLDEFDRLQSKEGLGEFLKVGTDAPEGLSAQFVLIGVADDLQQIGTDHESAERKIVPILVDRFTTEETAAFVNDLNSKLAPIQMAFSTNFSRLLFEYGDGFPFMCQQLANDAAMRKLSAIPLAKKADNEESIIDADEFWLALDSYLDPKIDQGGRYQKLRNSVNNVNKEEILVKLAEFSSGWVTQEELKDSLRSNYRFQQSLSQLHDQGVIVDHNRHVRFFDPRIRAIVRNLSRKGVRLYSRD